jgi:cyclomaltodextrinase
MLYAICGVARHSPVILALALTAASVGATEPPLAFDTAGGDAWTFEKVIEARVRAGRCDTVAIKGPLGTTNVRPVRERVVARIPLAPGDNVIEAECQKAGSPNGTPATQHWFVRLKDSPKAKAHAIVTTAGTTLDGGKSEVAAARPVPIVRYEWRTRAGSAGPLVGLPADGKRVDLRRPAADGEYYVTLRVTDTLGRVDESTATFRVMNGTPEAVNLERDQTAWIDAAVIYGIAPLRFGPHGLSDVTARLDELSALGVTTLWLAPITAAPPGDFGYAVTDHFQVRPSVGGEAELRVLINAAHARGLRVIVDLVPNHLSEEHSYYIDVMSRARASPYFSFFARSADGTATHYFDWRNLKNLNYENQEVERLIIEASVYWVREFDIDGFRVDAAWGPTERAPQFWPRWRAELKRIKPDLLLLAEASARDPYYFYNGFDAAYDWTEKLGEWAWKAAFENESVRQLRAAIGDRGPGAPLVFRFLNNNDTGPRFSTRYGIARTRIAVAMLLTLPGLPGLYTGEEVGASFEPYREEAPIAWDDPDQLRGWYTRLLELRRRHPTLRSRELRLLDLDPADQVLAYVRPAKAPDRTIMVLLNYGATQAEVTIPENMMRSLSPNGKLIDLLHGKPLSLSYNSRVTLRSYGVRVLQGE